MLLVSLQSDFAVTARTTYEDLKRHILAAGRYSVFDITKNRFAEALYAQLEHDNDIIVDRIGYPWIRVRARSIGEEVLTT